jgi:type II secretory pathway pseudopilin PulG
MKKFFLVVGVIAIVIAAGWAVRAVSTIQAKARNARLSDDIESLFGALQKYKEHAGAYPKGSNADIARALQGQNEKKVTVLVGRKLELNAKGEYVDPWSTPLRIYFSDTSVLIRSAGPNGRFDESTAMEFDDYIRSN